ncbi:hypothetical protein C3O70_22545, partial [Cronobacter sakazakii]
SGLQILDSLPHGIEQEPDQSAEAGQQPIDYRLVQSSPPFLFAMSCGAGLVHLIFTDALDVVRDSFDANGIVGLIC